MRALTQSPSWPSCVAQIQLRPEKASASSKPIATARLSLAALLKAGSDFKRERLPLKPGVGEKGSEAGSVLVSTAGYKALTALSGDVGGATAVVVSVSGITIKSKELLKEVAPPSRRGGAKGAASVHVLITMPGASEVKSADVAIATDGTATLSFEHTFDVSANAGGAVRTELLKALSPTGEPGDAEVTARRLTNAEDGLSYNP